MPYKKIPKERLIDIIPEAPMRVKFKDIFDLKGFYSDLREWLKEYGWFDKDGTDHWESYYGERRAQDGKREMWIRWRPERKAHDAPFMTYYLDFNWHCVAITSTEIVRDGVKIAVNKGEVELYMKPYIELNYMETFSENWFLRQMQDLFTKRIYHKSVEQRKKELYQETYEMQNWIKQWFKLKRYLPYEEIKSFFPGQSWPSHVQK